MRTQLSQASPPSATSHVQLRPLAHGAPTSLPNPRLSYKLLLDLDDDRVTTLSANPRTRSLALSPAMKGKAALEQFRIFCQCIREDIEKWKERGDYFQIYIPVPTDVLLSPSFRNTLKGFLLPPSDALDSRIHLVLQDCRPEHNLSLLRRAILSCMLMGVDVGLEGFGGGYANLNVLVSLPLTSLTFSPDLISNIDTNIRIQRIFSGCVAIAQDMGVRTIADGVCSADQKSLLKHFGCTQAKGPWIDDAFSAEYALNAN